MLENVELDSWTFLWQPVPRPDISPIDSSSNERYRDGHFPDWAAPNRTFPRPDISPTNHPPDQTFAPPSPTKHFPKYDNIDIPYFSDL